MTLNLDGKRFTIVSNSAGDAKPGETLFQFEQSGNAVRATYSGGGVALGSMVGTISAEGLVEVLFCQVSSNGELKGGQGRMKAEIKEDGKLGFVDDWSFLINATGTGRAIWSEI